MKKRLFRISTVLLLLISVFLCGCDGDTVNIPSPTEDFYVNDFADVLSGEDETKILSAGAALERASAAALGKDTGAQVVAVTVGTTEGMEIGEYALNLGRQWGVGNREDNNGVVILLATEDREVYVAVGYGLEGRLPDSKTGRIIDTYAIDYFSENEFSAGMLNLYNAILREVYAEYGIDVPEGLSAPQTYSQYADLDDVGMSWAVIAVIIILCIFYMRKRGLIMFFGPGFYGSGRGGFGGSSGGFGGFSGGGGGFGGGGAGRGF